MEQQAEALDTFDEGVYTEGPMDEAVEETATEEQSTEEVSEQTETEEKVDEDPQVNMLDNNEEKAEEEAPKEPKADGEGDKVEQKADSDGEEQNTENDGDSAEEVRNLKASRGGKQYEIPEDAEFKVKVNGKWEKVPLTELRDNYSGKVAYDEKFQELNSQAKTFKAEKENYDSQIEMIKGQLTEVAKLMRGSIEGENSPMEGIEYLIDVMGGNALQYKKAMYGHMAQELEMYAHMTEAERDAFWVRQENEYLTKRQESLEKQSSERQTQAESERELAELREAHGISAEDYDSIAEDLREGGLENMTPEDIIHGYKLKPLMLEADRLLEPYRDQMGDEEFESVCIEIATTMLDTPDMSIDQIKKILAEEFEVDDIVSTLVEKTETSETKNVSAPSPKSNHLESFDDFDY